MKILISTLLICCMIAPDSGIADDDIKFDPAAEVAGVFARLKDEGRELIKTPFLTENGNLFITFGVLGATSLTYAFDNEINLKIQQKRTRDLDKTANSGSLAGDPFLHLGFAAVIYGAGVAADSLKWKETGEMVGEALILADASTFLLKEATGRGRPSASSFKGDFKLFGFKTEYDSFPSMHTASSFALASVMSATTESIALKTAYYSAAAFVGFSRIYGNKHWASDVVFGAALGEVCGRIVTRYHASGKSVTFAPLVFEQGGGLALVKKW